MRLLDRIARRSYRAFITGLNFQDTRQCPMCSWAGFQFEPANQGPVLQVRRHLSQLLVSGTTSACLPVTRQASPRAVGKGVALRARALHDQVAGVPDG